MQTVVSLGREQVRGGPRTRESWAGGAAGLGRRGVNGNTEWNSRMVLKGDREWVLPHLGPCSLFLLAGMQTCLSEPQQPHRELKTAATR